MKRKYIIFHMGILLGIGAAAFPAAAASPEFAYSAEKWETLKDNKLEFDEIAELVHEYNVTVQQNKLDYQDYKGKDSYDFADDYYDSADDLSERTEYPDESNPAYAGLLMSALSSEIQAESLKEMGDNNVDDGEIKKLGYDSAEKQIVKQAQELMISYWEQAESISGYEDAVSQAEKSLNAVETRYTAGLAVKSEVDQIKKSVASAKAQLLSAQSGLEETRGNLLILLGWDHDAEVEIGALPEADMESLEKIDLETDLLKAQEANFDLKITERRIQNAQKSTVKKKQEETYANQKSNVAESVKNAYSDLILAKNDYEQAQETCALAKTSLDSAKLRLSAGLITAKSYEDQSISYDSSVSAMESAERKLLSAKLLYDWAISGLAKSS